MAREFDIAVFMGDGIGPEVMRPTLRLLDRLCASSGDVVLQFSEHPAGAGYYSEHGVSLPPESLNAARNADAILLSAMGDPSIRMADGTEISPQIELRQELNLYVGMRPVRVRPGYPTPLKLPPDATVDFMLLRESTEGLFWSLGRGEVSDTEARETMVITRPISEKLFHHAFRIAEQRRTRGLGAGHVTCVDKANVFRAFAFFRSIFEEVAAGYGDIESEGAYVDAVALWMVQKPWSFDVLVTENMFGDILSDLGAGLMGGLGLAPSADVGDGHAVFQPCHGSAPDIAGQGIANPIAMILSAGMMMDWLAQQHDMSVMADAAKHLRTAVDKVIIDGRVRTPDIGGKNTTEEVADAIIDAMDL